MIVIHSLYVFIILPHQDYLLEDAPSVYYALFREMAHLAAWDHQGQFLEQKKRHLTFNKWFWF